MGLPPCRDKIMGRKFLGHLSLDGFSRIAFLTGRPVCHRDGGLHFASGFRDIRELGTILDSSRWTALSINICLQSRANTYMEDLETHGIAPFDFHIELRL